MKLWGVRLILLISFPIILPWAVLVRFTREVGRAFLYAYYEGAGEVASFRRYWRDGLEAFDAEK